MEDKNITIELTPKQYEDLLKWAFAGQNVFYTYHHPGKKKIDEVDKFFQYLMERGKDHKKIIRKDEDGYDISDKMMQEIFDRIGNFTMAATEDIMMDQMELIMAEEKQKGVKKAAKKTILKKV